MSEGNKFVSGYISNKRFYNIKERLREYLNDDVVKLDEVLRVICEETNYNPVVKQYDERKAECIKRYRMRKKEKEKNEK